MCAVPNCDRRTNEPALIYRRFRAALALQDLAVEDVARLARVSSRHIWFVLNGQRRPSGGVLTAIREAVGAEGWLFATGQTDTLPDARGGHV